MSDSLHELMGKMAPAMAVPEATEICFNRADEVAFVDTSRGWQRVVCPGANHAWAEALSRAAGFANGGKGGKAAKLLEVDLPGPTGLMRALFVFPPLCEPGTVVIAIRIPSPRVFDHNELADGGLYDMAQLETGVLQDFEVELLALYDRAKVVTRPKDRGVLIKRFMELAVTTGRTIFIAGGTNYGKTTLQKAYAALIPKNRRIVTLESNLELTTPNHENSVHLLYDNSKEGHYSPDDLMMAALRLRPDDLLFAEVRNALEAKTFVRALRSGHQSAMATGHAGSVAETFSMLARNIAEGERLQDAIEELKRCIDIVAVFGTFWENGIFRRRIIELYFDPNAKRRMPV